MEFGWVKDCVSTPLWIQELRKELKNELDYAKDIGYEEGFAEGALLTEEASHVITAAQKYVERRDAYAFSALCSAVEAWQNKRADVSEFMTTNKKDT